MDSQIIRHPLKHRNSSRDHIQVDCPAVLYKLIIGIYIKALQQTNLEFVANILPFFSNSDRRGDGGGVAF